MDFWERVQYAVVRIIMELNLRSDVAVFKCLDINECQTRQHNCHVDADCSDTPGCYECNCKEGFFGDRQICISLLFYTIEGIIIVKELILN